MSEVEPGVSRPARRRRRKPAVWPQSAETKRAVLDAAKVLFAEQGYDGTTISDIVERSGVSVGSIYHQFGGKAEVCMALLEREYAERAAVSWRAVDKARQAGENDPVELYLAGATAYLMGEWKDRELARITLGDDSPPEAASHRRKAEARFLRAAADSMVIGDPPLPDSSAHAVTSLLRSAAVQLLDVTDRAVARRVVDYYVGLIRVLARSDVDLARRAEHRG